MQKLRCFYLELQNISVLSVRGGHFKNVCILANICTLLLPKECYK